MIARAAILASLAALALPASGLTITSLWVGSSYTDPSLCAECDPIQPLPEAVAELVAPLGHTLIWQLSACAACTLQTHAAGSAPATISTGSFDLIVLQEQAHRPASNPGQMYADLEFFGDAAQAAGSRVVLYQTWPPSDGADPAPYETTYCEAAAGVRSACTGAGVPAACCTGIGSGCLPAPCGVIPFGYAWRRALGEAPSIGLRAPDGLHHSEAGLLLAAYVAAREIFGVDPRDLATSTTAITGVGPTDGQALQQIAATTTRCGATRFVGAL